MSDQEPQNIVEAYAAASRTAAKYPEQAAVYDKVVDFCENDAECRAENSLKRNMLLFWSYDHMAAEHMEKKEYEQALRLWRRARHLPQTPEMRIELGHKMLEAVDRSHLSIPRKAGIIADTAVYLQQAYQATGDEDNSRKMKRMIEVASHLLRLSGKRN